MQLHSELHPANWAYSPGPASSLRASPTFSLRVAVAVQPGCTNLGLGTLFHSRSMPTKTAALAGVTLGQRFNTNRAWQPFTHKFILCEHKAKVNSTLRFLRSGASPITRSGGAAQRNPFHRELTYILHSGISYIVVYIESRAFTRRLYQLAGAAALDVLSAVQADLIKNPARGDLVPGLGGIRNARCSNPARRKGKRGGYGYLFLYLENRSHIHLLYLLDKDEQEDLSNDERKELRALVAEIKATR